MAGVFVFSLAYTGSAVHGRRRERTMPHICISDENITHTTTRCLMREGSTPVLEITVTYPVLRVDETPSPAVDRFNDGYRAVADAFASWAGSALLPEAAEAFRSAGSRAAYTFDRRQVTCCMTATIAVRDAGLADKQKRRSAKPCLTVRRTVAFGSRRGSVSVLQTDGEERWYLSDLTLS